MSGADHFSMPTHRGTWNLVIPRAHAMPQGESLALDTFLAPWLTDPRPGAVAIIGELGAGKTTALAHIATLIPDHARARVQLLDEPGLDLVRDLTRQSLVIFTIDQCPDDSQIVTDLQLQLEPWGQDDLIEYLLAQHPARCRSVMARVKQDAELDRLQGVPELCRLALDALAGDESLPSVTAALRKHVDSLLPTDDLRQVACERTWLSLTGRPSSEHVSPLLHNALPLGLRRMLQHRPVQLLLAARKVAEDLDTLSTGAILDRAMPRDLVRDAAVEIRRRATAMANLRGITRYGLRARQHQAASLLVIADPSWRPDGEHRICLSGACLRDVRWARANLREFDMSDADLLRADLSGALMDRALLYGAVLRDARLSRATLEHADASGADLGRADLSFVQAAQANFTRADLSAADLHGAHLRQCRFGHANMEGVRLCGADLTGAEFNRTHLDQADLSDANCRDARFVQLSLRDAVLRGASFARAHMEAVDLEYVDLPRADFEGAVLKGCLFTGSYMPAGNFRGAGLHGAGLADIDWEEADLRDADFTNASFHLGSSRSGRVNSVTPSEGSRTGFYTDDFNEQDFKSPEEIRKANLRGADLRGATVERADFYLVDLRDAQYTPEQGKHFARCGAILKSRSA